MSEKKKTEETGAKFREIVDKKIQKILSKKIPEPRYLSKKTVEEKTDRLALSEMQRFRKEHERAPTRQELERIAESVYLQVKQEAQKKEVHSRHKSRKSFLEQRKKRRGKKEEQVNESGLSIAEQRRERRLKRMGKKEDKKIEDEKGGFEPEIGEKPQESISVKKELEGMDVSDIFSEKKESLEPDDVIGEDDFGDLEKELSGLSKGDDLVSKEMSTEKSKCPNCKTFTQDLVFCPECGTAFCSHCAKKVESLGEQTKFTCPKCKKSFKTKS